jgi:hypothetical protein
MMSPHSSAWVLLSEPLVAVGLVSDFSVSAESAALRESDCRTPIASDQIAQPALGRALDSCAAAVERRVSDIPQVCPSAGFADLKRVSLFVERMRSNARRRRGSVRGHTLKLEAIVVENA